MGANGSKMTDRAGGPDITDRCAVQRRESGRAERRAAGAEGDGRGLSAQRSPTPTQASPTTAASAMAAATMDPPARACGEVSSQNERRGPTRRPAGNNGSHGGRGLPAGAGDNDVSRGGAVGGDDRPEALPRTTGAAARRPTKGRKSARPTGQRPR